MKVRRMYNHLGNRCETISRRKSSCAALPRPRKLRFRFRGSYVKESLLCTLAARLGTDNCSFAFLLRIVIIRESPHSIISEIARNHPVKYIMERPALQANLSQTYTTFSCFPDKTSRLFPMLFEIIYSFVLIWKPSNILLRKQFNITV